MPRHEVEEAIAFAEAAPDPELSTLLYADITVAPYIPQE